MSYDRSAISVIETALDTNPFCRGAIGRLLFALFSHERVVMIN